MGEADATVAYLPGTLARLSKGEQVKAMGGSFKQTEFLAAAILASGPIRLDADSMQRGRGRNQDLAIRYLPAERVWECHLEGDDRG